MAVLDPLKLVLTDWDEVIGADRTEPAAHRGIPAHADRGASRRFGLGPELWIERDDFWPCRRKASTGWRRRGSTAARPSPATGCGCATAMSSNAPACRPATTAASSRCRRQLVADTKSGTPGADRIKVKGVISWVGAHEAVQAEVRLYDRLFLDEHPDTDGKGLLASLNPPSKQVVTATGSSRRWRAPRRTTTSSSSATAISSPTASTIGRDGWSSTGRQR